MMRPGKLLILLLLMMAVLAALALSAAGEPGNFILENADASKTITLSSSATLKDLIGAVLPRFVLEFADSNRTRSITAPPAALVALTNNLAPRVVLEFADRNAVRSMAYPKGLIGDTTPPQQTGAGVSSTGGTVVFSWTTNEPAIGTVLYGLQPGVLNNSVSGTLYATQHAISVAGLEAGQTIYYRLASADRSGNTAQTAEQSYKVVQGTKLYLPSVIR